jgi:hypothetical protein
MPPWPCRLAGRLDKLTITSGLLRANPLSDPCDRPLWVYLPPGYDDGADRFPSVYMLHGYGSSVASWENRPVYGRPFLELADQAFTSGRAEPAVVVFVDGWTRYGGSQYIDSAGTGRYLSYLCDEIVPYVDGAYRTMAARDHRAVIGKSSGGFGALVATMLRPLPSTGWKVAGWPGRWVTTSGRNAAATFLGYSAPTRASQRSRSSHASRACARKAARGVRRDAETITRCHAMTPPLTSPPERMSPHGSASRTTGTGPAGHLSAPRHAAR